MNCLVCLTLADATAERTAMDTAAGYPKDGANIGGGLHVSVLEGRTFHHAAIQPHPTLATAAVYPYGAAEIAFGVTPPAGSLVQVLDPATWFPSVVIASPG